MREGLVVVDPPVEQQNAVVFHRRFDTARWTDATLPMGHRNRAVLPRTLARRPSMGQTS
jgi:hypothetical protein